MKIVFLEVRSKTSVYEEIAEEIGRIDDQVEIYWIVQNKLFSKIKSDNIFFLEFPKTSFSKYDKPKLDHLDEEVISADRFHIHFESTCWHYVNYRRQVEDILRKISPDVVFGELGNFFTHYACLWSKKNSIPFYDIESARFPKGCVGVFLYDKWNPVKLRDVKSSDVENFINDFRTLKPVPDYMVRPEDWNDLLRNKLKLINHKVKLLRGYVSGERYCTQHPIKNILEKIRVRQRLKLWDKASCGIDEVMGKKKKILLYPLQMQPEFNLEVWGRPWSDQQQVIMSLLDKMPDDWVLLIKANPKPYFEMNRIDLMALVGDPKIMFLERGVSMQEIDSCVDIVATVTGTVQIERIINNKPVYIIGDTPFRKFSCIRDGIDWLTGAELDLATRFSLSDDQVRQAARLLLECSAPGIMGEPVSNGSCLERRNIERLTAVVLEVISKHKT
ncbi:hypothetical protein [Castellaniella sp.]|uniref:hypothetical protein n=1 Tax=Castellaniella sp. TaxID=1955812 RepID=UPI003C7117F4